MKKIILYSLIIPFVLIGCSDFLDQKPKLTTSNELSLSTYNGLNSATLGAYAPLYSTDWYGSNFILAAELRGGNSKNPISAGYGSSRMTDDPKWNYTETGTSPLWNIAYFTISAANNVLNAADNVTDANEADIKNLKAECLFIRALAHFDLVRIYAQPYSYKPEMAGVPYIEITQPGKPARNTIKQCYDNIVIDLLKAETLMEDDYKRTGLASYKGAAQKPAIQALLSRVYLYMGEYQKSADYATKVINNSNYRLWTSAEYPNQWGEAIGTDEIIFEVEGNSAYYYRPYWTEIHRMTNPIGYADVVTTTDLLDLFTADPTDVRGTMFTAVAGIPERWTKKYPGKGIAEPDASNIPVLRLSEMYLNRAEAILNGATIAGVTALGDLNAIAGNRGATLHTVADDNAIYLERRKELCYEGHLVFDHARWQKGIVRTDNFFTNIANKDIPFPSNKWALPIPKTETATNPNLEQNPN